MNDDVKLLFKKIITEKKIKIKDINKIEQLEFLLVRIKYANNPNKLESALRELNRIEGIDENLHEFKNEKFLDYVGAFDLVGNLKIGDQLRQTNIRF